MGEPSFDLRWLLLVHEPACLVWIKGRPFVIGLISKDDLIGLIKLWQEGVQLGPENLLAKKNSLWGYYLDQPFDYKSMGEGVALSEMINQKIEPLVFREGFREIQFTFRRMGMQICCPEEMMGDLSEVVENPIILAGERQEK